MSPLACFPYSSRRTRPRPRRADAAGGRHVLGLLGPVVLALLALTASGCGFKLRGALDLPPELRVVYIKTNRSTDTPPTGLESALTSLLRGNGVTIAQDPKQATAILEILNESQNSRTLAAARENQARLSTLTYQVTYRVLQPDGKVLAPEAVASATRDLLYPESAVLAREQGTQLARRDMETDIARAILRRLAIVAPRP